MTTSEDTRAAASSSTAPDGERADLLEALRKHRGLFRVTVAGLTDEQARRTPTVSTLSLGGLIKHVAATEQEWARFIVHGPAEAPAIDWNAVDWDDPPPEVRAYAEGFQLLDGETLEGVLARYDEVAAATDELVLRADLDARRPLPAAPWFEPGASWSARRVFLHVVAETAQHAGHADILRETIDGQRTMG
jgi:hypothetical protein